MKCHGGSWTGEGVHKQRFLTFCRVGLTLLVFYLAIFGADLSFENNNNNMSTFVLPRSWACADGEEEENASEARKQFLRENREKVHWLYEPPSWWNEEEEEIEESNEYDMCAGGHHPHRNTPLTKCIVCGCDLVWNEKVIEEEEEEEERKLKDAIKRYYFELLEQCSDEELFELSGL